MSTIQFSGAKLLGSGVREAECGVAPMADFERKAQSQVTSQVGAVSQASCDFLDVPLRGVARAQTQNDSLIKDVFGGTGKPAEEPSFIKAKKAAVAQRMSKEQLQAAIDALPGHLILRAFVASEDTRVETCLCRQGRCAHTREV
jgi:hypothetical protein